MRYAAFLVLTMTVSLVFAEGHKNNERENTIEIVMSAWKHLAKIDMEKFNEYITTGQLKTLERARGDPLYLFPKIYGLNQQQYRFRCSNRSNNLDPTFPVPIIGFYFIILPFYHIKSSNPIFAQQIVFTR